MESKVTTGSAVSGLLAVVSVLSSIPILLAVTSWPASAQAPSTKTPRERPVPRLALERASEAGGWWMIAQTACDVARGTAILEKMNTLLSGLKPDSWAIAVSERIQDPFLPEADRLKMEAGMRRVSELQALAGDIRGVEGDIALAAKEMKPLPARLDRPEWKLSRPVVSEAELAALREATDRSLDRACADSIERLQVRFIDEKTGIRPLLR